MTTCFAYFFFSCCADNRDLHSFPTRRSSDLRTSTRSQPSGGHRAVRTLGQSAFLRHVRVAGHLAGCVSGVHTARCRSEEHTSELQSRPHLVCRLLLEKKKKTTTTDLLKSTAM